MVFGGPDIALILLFGSIVALVIFGFFDARKHHKARKLANAIRELSDTNYRQYLIQAGAGTPELIHAVKKYKIPEEFTDAARAYVTQKGGD